jgi:hypothetical protein
MPIFIELISFRSRADKPASAFSKPVAAVQLSRVGR